MHIYNIYKIYIIIHIKYTYIKKNLSTLLFNLEKATNLGKLYLLPKIYKRLGNVPGKRVISNSDTPT